ncbi:MAG: hypothetical protein IPK13_26040 [Deltaproteobacteria bacterium]|nr:hypothetical protein [Deltaproteobacteria bacterium]
MTRLVVIAGAMAFVRCGDLGSIKGAGFELGDAIYSLQTDPATGISFVDVVVSGAEDLCARARARSTMAGQKVLRVRAFEGGSSRFDFVAFDAGCQTLAHDRSDYGWAEVEGSGFEDREVTLAIRTASRNVTGQFVARHCYEAAEWSMTCAF